MGMELSLEVESVQLPLVTGEIGVLPGHVPLLGAVKPGVLRYRSNGQNAVAAIGGPKASTASPVCSCDVCAIPRPTSKKADRVRPR